MTKRIVIDQAMCDHVRILLSGGAKVEQAAQIIGIGDTTVSRIKKAGFNAEVYQQKKGTAAETGGGTGREAGRRAGAGTDKDGPAGPCTGTGL